MIKRLLLIMNIWKWHKKTFPECEIENQQDKFRKEVREFIQASDKYIKQPQKRRNLFRPQMLEETADVIIAGINLLKYPEIYERVSVKHSINTHRTWEGDQHVSECE